MVRRALPLSLAVLIVLVSVGAAIGAWTYEHDRAHREQDARAQATTAALRFQLAVVVVSLEGMRGLVEGSGTPDEERFAAFAASSLQRRGGLLAAWAPRVSRADRPEWERRAGRRILQQAPGARRPTPAPRRAEYFPVALVEPAPGAPLLGLDLGSTLVGRQIIADARDTGLTRMTPPVGLRDAGGAVIILLRAVYGGSTTVGDGVAGRRAAFTGVVASAHRLRELGETVLATLPAGTQLEIRDGGDVVLPAAGDMDDASETTLEVAGRTLTVRVAGAGGPSPILPATVLAAGLLLGGLAWLLFRSAAHRAADAERAAGELARAAERHRAVVETAADGIITIDEQGRIDTVNGAAERMFGYSEAELTGRDITLLMPEPDRTRHPDYIERYLRTGERRIIGVGRDVKGLRRDGSVFPMHLSVADMRVGDERRFTGIVRDISARVAAEAKVRALNEELEERVAERTRELEVANRELEAFSYSVSHDLRAPLRSVGGLSAMLVEDHADALDADARGLLGRIRTAAERMGALIDDLLGLARISRAEMRREDVDLGEIAARVAAGLRESDPGRDVEFRIAEGLRASGDPRLLRVVLENLLGNSWKFTRDQPAPVVEFGARGDNGTTEFYVSDNGAGFDMAYADKLFGPFQRLHHMDEFEGTGIGLATVQRIVRRHGGDVRAEGTVDGGATMSFTIPPPEDAR